MVLDIGHINVEQLPKWFDVFQRNCGYTSTIGTLLFFYTQNIRRTEYQGPIHFDHLRCCVTNVMGKSNTESTVM